MRASCLPLSVQSIHHVVARAHHPQTVGKCERLWATVKKELWERVRPRDLDEARERLGHYFGHHNHHRPHESLGGLVPADRFFGVAADVRQALEQAVAKNALRLALGEAPRRPVFLVGQIDGQAVSVHGEAGRIVVQTPDGVVREIEARDLGMGTEGVRAKEADGADAEPTSTGTGGADATPAAAATPDAATAEVPTSPAAPVPTEGTEPRQPAGASTTEGDASTEGAAGVVEEAAEAVEAVEDTPSEGGA